MQVFCQWMVLLWFFTQIGYGFYGAGREGDDSGCFVFLLAIILFAVYLGAGAFPF